MYILHITSLHHRHAACGIRIATMIKKKNSKTLLSRKSSEEKSSLKKHKNIVRVTAPFCCLLLVLHWNAVTETIFSIERSSLSFSWHPDKAVEKEFLHPSYKNPHNSHIRGIYKLHQITNNHPINIQACWIFIVAIGYDTSLVNHVECIQTWFSYSFGQDCS